MSETWDAFISYASEDRQSFARPLADELKTRGLRVWFDDFELKVGDSLRRSIDHGIANAEFGIVVLSHSFFAKEWPQRELDALAGLESDRKRLLPVWHGVGQADVQARSPILAARYALRSDAGVRAVADGLDAAIRPDAARAISDVAWLQAALTAFDSESDSMKDRWIFHLRSAERAIRTSVRIEVGSHYDAVDKLHRLGILDEIQDEVARVPGSRHRGFRFFMMTDKARILLEALQSSHRLR